MLILIVSKLWFKENEIANSQTNIELETMRYKDGGPSDCKIKRDTFANWIAPSTSSNN